MATGPDGPVYVLTLGQLQNTLAGIQAKENADRAILASYMNMSVGPTTSGFFAWATAGFPDNYVVASQSFTIPSVCSDGNTYQSLYAYASYLIGVDLGTAVAMFSSKLLGIELAYSVSGTNIAIKATALPNVPGATAPIVPAATDPHSPP